MTEQLPDYHQVVTHVYVCLRVQFDAQTDGAPVSLSLAVLTPADCVETYQSMESLAAALICENRAPRRLAAVANGHVDLVPLPAFLWYELQLLMLRGLHDR